MGTAMIEVERQVRVYERYNADPADIYRRASLYSVIDPEAAQMALKAMSMITGEWGEDENSIDVIFKALDGNVYTANYSTEEYDGTSYTNISWKNISTGNDIIYPSKVYLGDVDIDGTVRQVFLETLEGAIIAISEVCFKGDVSLAYPDQAETQEMLKKAAGS